MVENQNHSRHLHRKLQTEGHIGQAFFLNLFFSLIELAGGLLTNSLAVLSDALHDFGDSISLGLAWYFQWLSKKESDENFSYGYGRFSLLGALVNSVILTGGSVVILSRAIPGLLEPEEVHSLGMLWLALLGVAINTLAVLTLKKGQSLNEKVVRLHLLEDVFGWVAVLIGAGIMYFTKWFFIDPLLSILIAGWILWHAFTNLKKSLKIFLQSTPEDISIEKIHQKLYGIPEIQAVHDCHVWSLDGEYNILSIHLVIDKETTLKDQALIKRKAKNLLLHESIDHITIEFECTEEDCDAANT